jgi:hypothetical protein
MVLDIDYSLQYDLNKSHKNSCFTSKWLKDKSLSSTRIYISLKTMISWDYILNLRFPREKYWLKRWKYEVNSRSNISIFSCRVFLYNFWINSRTMCTGFNVGNITGFSFYWKQRQNYIFKTLSQLSKTQWLPQRDVTLASNYTNIITNLLFKPQVKTTGSVISSAKLSFNTMKKSFNKNDILFKGQNKPCANRPRIPRSPS